MMFAQFYAILLYYVSFLSDSSYGCKGKETQQDWQPFKEKVGSKLSDYFFRRVYRMKRVTFDKLHSILEPRLDEIFFPKGGGKRNVETCPYLIDTKTRLSIAIRFFAGADPYDIMLIHDVSLTSVYYSVWGVIDAINTTDGLAYHFPNHEKQKEIAEGFFAKSGAGFSNVIDAIDSLIICILMPCLASRSVNAI